MKSSTMKLATMTPKLHASSRRIKTLITIAPLLSLVASAHAASVMVPNFSFELPALGINGAAVGNPTNWNGTGTVGYVYNGWNGGAINVTGLDGNQLGWFNTDVGTSMSQLLTTTFTAGQSYELRVAAVKASNAWSGSTAANAITIQLYYGAFNVIASGTALAQDLNTSQGAMTDITANLTTVAGADAWAGQAIGIRIISTADGANNNDWAVDNVRLTAVPEPSSAVLVSCLGFLAIVRRRRA